jgi:hypothetical protein
MEQLQHAQSKNRKTTEKKIADRLAINTRISLVEKEEFPNT